MPPFDVGVTQLFQSTLSMRRATQYHYGQTVNLSISIHALHEESDPPWTLALTSRLIFQSTLSMRRATRRRRYPAEYRAISIHALHEESDVLGSMWGNLNLPISIHALHEESDTGFIRGARRLPISIHALHEESDAR